MPVVYTPVHLKGADNDKKPSVVGTDFYCERLDLPMVDTLLFHRHPWLEPAVLRYGYCNACEAKRFLTDGTPRPLKLRRLL